MLTESMAWREVAKRVEAKNHQDAFLCNEIRHMGVENAISPKTCKAMIARIDAFTQGRTLNTYLVDVDFDGNWYYYQHTNPVRIMICVLFALDADR